MGFLNENRILLEAYNAKKDFAADLCPEGTMTLAEFDNLLTQRITELWNEKYGSDYKLNNSKRP